MRSKSIEKLLKMQKLIYFLKSSRLWFHNNGGDLSIHQDLKYITDLHAI